MKLGKWWWSLCLLAMGFILAGADVLNDDFSSSTPGRDLPDGWSRYGTRGPDNFVKVIRIRGKNAVQIVDRNEKETGIARTLPVQPGKFYRATVQFSELGKLPPKPPIRLRVLFQSKTGKPASWCGSVKTRGTTVFSGPAPAQENTPQ